MPAPCITNGATIPRAGAVRRRAGAELAARFAVARVDGDPVAFAGLWETWRPEVNHLLSPIQHRMPVIVERADWPVWLDEADGASRVPARYPGPETGNRIRRSGTPGCHWTDASGPDCEQAAGKTSASASVEFGELQNQQ